MGHQPVAIEVFTSNLSDHNILLPGLEPTSEQAGPIYKVEVLDAQRIAPRATAFGRQFKNIDMQSPNTNVGVRTYESGSRLSLRPGESWTDRIVINKLYDIVEAGQYSVQVQRFDPEANTWIKSNIITITVTL